MDQSNFKNKIASEEFRCSDCGKLLAINNESDLTLSIKCTRCGSLNSIFKGVTEQVIITDKDGLIVYANSMVESNTGYSLQEILGKKPSLWGGQMSKEFYKEMWRVIKVEKKSVAVEVRNKKKDGTFYNAKLRISAVFGIDNEVKMFVGIETVI